MDYQLKKLLTPGLYEDIENIVKNTSDFNMFENKSVLVTGAGSLIGYYLVCCLLIGNDINDSNTKIIATDKEKDLFKKYGVINSRDDIDFVISNFYSNFHQKNVDYIIHTDVDVTKGYFECMENLLNYGKDAGCKEIMLCTDMSVYGEVYNGKSKISETDEGYIDLNSTYGACIQAQRMAEIYAKAFCSDNNIGLKFARMSEIFGAGGIEFQQAEKVNEKNFVDEKNIAERFSEFCKGDVNVIKSYCYVTDGISALVNIMKKGNNGETYNVSANWDTSFKYIADVCEQLYPDITVNVSGRRNNISNDYSVSALSSTRKILDNSKLLSLGYIPSVSLADGIKRTVKIIRENI